MFRRVKRWLTGDTKPPEPPEELNGELRQAMQKLESSNRQIQREAQRSTEAFSHLNMLLAMRMRAMDGMHEAEEALRALDEARERASHDE